MLPIFREHDHQEFEVVAYSSTRVRDAHHDEFRKLVDLWRDVQRVNDADLADIIREDRIDILVDLSMHMAHHRLLTFARQPSPIQVTYLAYCGTTGLDTIQYRLTDPHLDPPGTSDDVYSEKSVRFFDSYWCYEPNVGMEIDIDEAPCHKDGVITFGCLNNFCKITESTLSVWAGILRRVPRSRLLLHAMYGSHRERVLQRMASHHIDADRIAFVANVPFEDYMSLYKQIDIALDPFPYGGGTTTCDALWMGVPVITLRGETAVGRGGTSILTNMGEDNLIATNIAGYEAIAMKLASESSRLDDYRQRLRSQMQRSPLMDGVGITRALERTYRQFWVDWTTNRTNDTNKERGS
jgi:predicted O-linked N-acetylglucosamine transferase (SPINDLY family)